VNNKVLAKREKQLEDAKKKGNFYAMEEARNNLNVAASRDSKNLVEELSRLNCLT
jgi:hypothetical protein